jgi:hypothetical protein
VTMLFASALISAQRGRHDEALDVLARAAADEEFGDWIREMAPKEPLLEPVRNDPRFPR